jgi:hypothetical protein
MNNTFFFQPKTNGNLSFRHNSLKENPLKSNQNKSLLITEDHREFGKDLTNLSNLTANQENINPNGNVKKVKSVNLI